MSEYTKYFQDLPTLKEKRSKEQEEFLSCLEMSWNNQVFKRKSIVHLFCELSLMQKKEFQLMGKGE